MKRVLWVLFHFIAVMATGGWWLILLVPYLFWRKFKKRSAVASSVDSEAPIAVSPRYSDSTFAQEGGRGAIFSYASLRKGEVLTAPYAVIDIETTGLDKSTHRIIEVAIRRIDTRGSLIDEMSTLINPGVTDVGPTFIHHINPEDVLDAPSFEEVAPMILSRLAGCIVVAHHAAFEDGFLGASFGRLKTSIKNLPCIDTLWLARQVIDLPNYKLGTVVGAFGIEEVDAHTALGDVRMLSDLLPLLLQKANPLRFNVSLEPFQEAGSMDKIKTRVSGLYKGQDGWMANVIKKLPESGQDLTNEVSIAYSELLSRVLSDGKITGAEAKELAKLAGTSGLGSIQLQQLHQDYVTAIEKIALIDGVLSDAEAKELKVIKTQLGL